MTVYTTCAISPLWKHHVHVTCAIITFATCCHVSVHCVSSRQRLCSPATHTDRFLAVQVQVATNQAAAAAAEWQRARVLSQRDGKSSKVSLMVMAMVVVVMRVVIRE